MRYARILILLLILGFLSLPFFLFPPHLPAELLLKEDWAVSEDAGVSTMATSDEAWRALPMNDDLIYVSPRGELGIRESRDFYMSFSDAGYINTSQYHDVLVFRNPLGDVLETLETRGFPMILNPANNKAGLPADDGADELNALVPGMFVVDPDGLGAGLRVGDRESDFSFRKSAFITGADEISFAGRLFYLVALSDGRVLLFDGNGQDLGTIDADDSSKYGIIYGAAFIEVRDPDGQQPPRLMIATVDGFDPTWFHLYRLNVADIREGGGEGKHWNRVLDLELPDRYRGLVKFSVTGDLGSGLDIGLSARGVAVEISVDLIDSQARLSYRPDNPSDEILLHQMAGMDGLRIRTVSSDSRSILLIRQPTGAAVFQRRLPSRASFSFDGRRIYMRSAGKISSYILEEG